jgi:hypothetical protein
MIRMTCPNPACGAQYTFPDQFAGRTVMCSVAACRWKIQVPMPTSPLVARQPPAQQARQIQAPPPQHNPGALTDLRCYDCGQRIYENELVRRDVKTGSSISWGSRSSRTTNRYSRVNVCRACSLARDKTAFVVAMVTLGVVGALLVIGLIAYLAR